MRYSQEFKDNVVARLLSKELSISETGHAVHAAACGINGSGKNCQNTKGKHAIHFEHLLFPRANH